MIFENSKYNFLIIPVLLLAGLFFGWLIFGSDAGSHDAHSHSQEKGTEPVVFTCSMHPQIRQNEPGKCSLCGMNLIPLSKNSGEVTNLRVYEMSREAVALANVQTEKVTYADAENELRLSGKILSDEQTIATIPAYFSGRIERLYVNFTGQEIRKGQKLATIYSPDLVTAQKELLEASKFRHINPALYESAREKLKLWKITEQQIRAIEEKGSIISNFEVYADKAGIVSRRLITEGDYVARGEVLFEVSDLGKVWVMLDAYESDLAGIRMGAVLKFEVPALPGKVYEAKVSYIDPFINTETRTAGIRAETGNKDGLLKPGMFVNASLRSERSNSEKLIAIPKTALLWTGKRSIVYVKVPEAKTPLFEMREVTVAASLDHKYLIETGLDAGEEVVMNGVFYVDAAAQLHGNYSMMNKDSESSFKYNAPEKFRIQLTHFTDAYLELTQALIESDPQKAGESSVELRKRLSSIDKSLLRGEALKGWNELSASLIKESNAIAATKELEKQRIHLSSLSNELIKAVEFYGLEKDSIYKAYCPMALDDQGAYWLSIAESVYNPYFGDSMLQCGEIQEVYKKENTEINKKHKVSNALHQH